MHVRTTAGAAICYAGCLTKSCSLACTKQHKQSTGCTGKRAREAFVPLLEYNEKHLVSDYRFVEEAIERKDAAVAQRLAAPREGAARLEQLPHHLQALVRSAGRAGINLQLMSPGATQSRHLLNQNCAGSVMVRMPSRPYV